jgi:hypothetical protein
VAEPDDAETNVSDHNTAAVVQSVTINAAPGEFVGDDDTQAIGARSPARSSATSGQTS